MKIKQVLFTKHINLVSIVHFVHSVNSQGVMNKMAKVGGVLFFLRANEQIKKSKKMASAMFTVKTGETDRMKAGIVGRAFFSMIPSSP